MLLRESHGHLGLCLHEGIYAWGAKSEICWVSSVFHSISQPEALAEPEGTNNYAWHFPSSLLFPLPSQILLLLHIQVWVYKCLLTHTCASLAWDVYGPSTFNVYSSIAFFCLCLTPCFCLETPSQVTYAANVLPVFLHPSPLNYCINGSINFLILLLVKIASTNKQFVWKPLHLLLHDYTIWGVCESLESPPVLNLLLANGLSGLEIENRVRGEHWFVSTSNVIPYHKRIS